MSNLPEEKQSPAARPGSDTADSTNNVAKRNTKAPAKKCRVLNYLLSGRTLNRFQAARLPEVADSALNSTIAELGGNGIRIDREDEAVEGRYGVAHVKRYAINRDAENIARAVAFLGNDRWVEPVEAQP